MPEERRSNPNQKKEYVTHNYSLIDQHIDRVEEKHQDLMQFRKLNRWKLLSSMSARVTCLIVGTILILSFITWMWTQDLDGLVTIDYQTYEFEILNDTFARIAAVTEELLNEKNETQLQLAQVRDSLNAFSPGEVGDITDEFTLFRKVKLEGEQFIITGLVYLPRDLTKPQYEYCYQSESEDSSNLKAKREDIAYKINERIMWQSPGSQLFELGQKHCKFTS